jgi:spore photoproduct lyase-like protein
MLFTKSDNVDFLMDLEHNGHTIISWSITCDTVSRLIDKRIAVVDDRIEAMRKTQEAGYIVRARLSPIVPIRNWRQEYTELFEKLFAKADPDIITLELLGWIDFGDLTMLLDPEILDPEAFESARAAADELRGVYMGPFTEDTHMEVYRSCIDTVKRLSPQTPVSICHGTPPMWDELGDLMGMTPGNYICNCGPMSAPGGKLYNQFHPIAAL